MSCAAGSIPATLCCLVLGSWGCSNGDSVGASGAIPNLTPLIFDLTYNPIDCTAQAANIAALYRSIDTNCR